MHHKYYWSNSQIVFLQKKLQEYNQLYTTDTSSICHGGCNLESSHNFKYVNYIPSFLGLTLGHMYITTKNVQKQISHINGILRIKTTK